MLVETAIQHHSLDSWYCICRHTSGANITADQDRALIFGSYNAPFLRGKVNQATRLSEETKGMLSDKLRERLGINRDGNLGLVKDVNKVF
jgi:hypothetical protein